MNERRARRWALGVWILLALGVRLIGLGQQSLWWDEAWQWEMASEPSPLAIVERLWREPLAAHPPLSHWIHHLFLQIDSSDFALRLPGALLGALGVAFVLELGRAWFDEATGQFAAALWTVSPLQVWFSQDARMYSHLMFFAAASTWLWWRALERNRIRDWTWVTLVSVLGLYTHLFFVLVVAIHLVWTLLARREVFVRMLASAALAGLAFTPMLPFFWTRRALLAGSEFNWLAPGYALFTYGAGFSLGPSVNELKAQPGWASVRPEIGWLAAVLLVFGVAGAIGLVRCWRDGDGRGRIALLGFGLPIAAVTVASLSPSFVFNVRYTVVAFPFFCLLIGAGVAGAIRRGAGGWVLVAGVYGLSLVSLSQWWTNPRYAKEDVRAAIQAWRRIPDRDLIASHAANVTVDRYLESDEADRHLPLGGAPEQEARDLVMLWQRRGTDRVLHILVARDANGIYRRALSQELAFESRGVFPGGVELIEVEAIRERE